MDLARGAWEAHRDDLLAAWDAPKATDYYDCAPGAPWGWGHLRPRLPAFAEALFDNVALPERPGPAWPAPAVRHWGLLAIAVCEQRAYDTRDEAEYRDAMQAAARYADAMHARLRELEPEAEADFDDGSSRETSGR
jgi:hypothetical protein